jgi:hypothetical protein
MTNLDNSRFTVNAYDVFANFLPGFILLTGVALPFLSQRTLPSLGAIEIVFYTFITFSIGGIVQAIGSKTKYIKFTWPFNESNTKTSKNLFLGILRRRVMPFDRAMNNIVIKSYERNRNNYDLSKAEWKFFDCCNEIFGFDSNVIFRDWGYLFKMCLAHLETSPHDRTLRIQAQHLAARGLYISFFILFILYSSLSVIQTGVFNNTIQQPLHALSSDLLFLMAVLCLIASWVFRNRSVHFEEDVVKYMISEMVASGSFDIQPDEDSN